MNSREALAIGSDTKVPVLFRGEYNVWLDRFTNFINLKDRHAEIKQSLQEGPQPTPMMEVPAQTTGQPAIMKAKPFIKMTEDEQHRYEGDRLAKSYLLQALPYDIYTAIDAHKETAKGMWDAVKLMMMGSRIGEQLQINSCIIRYDNFKQIRSETLTETYERFCLLMNDLTKNELRKSYSEINLKFLNNLQPEWKRFASYIRHNHILKNMPINEMFEMLVQDQEEVSELMGTDAPVSKPPSDPLALVSDNREMQKLQYSRQEPSQSEYGRQLTQSSWQSSGRDQNETEAEENDYNSDPEVRKIRNTMLFLSETLKNKKFFKKAHTNDQRYSTIPNKRHDHQERYEGKKRYDEEQSHEKRTEQRDKEEVITCYNCGKPGHYSRDCRKPKEEVTTCYNCGKPGHYSRDCRKAKVKNSEYYKNKMLLAKQEESGVALMADEDHWLNLTDDEKDVETHMCYMVNHSEKSDTEDEENKSFCQVCSPIAQTLYDQMQVNVRENDSLKLTIKEKSVLNSNLEDKVSVQNTVIETLSTDKAGCLCDIANLTTKVNKLLDECESLKIKLSGVTKRLSDSEDEISKSFHEKSFFEKENVILLHKVKDLETILHKVGQTEHTIHLNKPKEFTYNNTQWGIGYKDPHYLKTIMSQVPTLYSFECLGLDKDYPQYKINWTDADEIEKMEEEKRKTTSKMQLHFAYEELNYSYKKNKSNYLSNDYFLTAPDSKLSNPKEEDTELKLYIPTLFLENRIVQLEKSLEEERIIFKKEKLDLLESANSRKAGVVAENERESYRTEIARLTSKMADLATKILEDRVAGSDIQSPPATIYIPLTESVLETISPVNSPNSSNTSSCKAFLGETFQTMFDGGIENEPLFFNHDTDHKIASANHDLKNKGPLSSTHLPTVPRLSNEDFDFSTYLNSDEYTDEKNDSFDFTPSLPSFNDFIKTTNETPDHCQKVECSSSASVNVSTRLKQTRHSQKQRKSGNSISQKAYYYKSSDNGFNVFTDKNGRSKQFKQVWVAKSSKESNLKTNSLVFASKFRKNDHDHGCVNSNVCVELKTKFPLKIYSIQQLLQLSHDRVCCSKCGRSEFIDKRLVSGCFSSYNFHHKISRPPFMRNASNTSGFPDKKGPNLKWVPKSV